MNFIHRLKRLNPYRSSPRNPFHYLSDIFSHRVEHLRALRLNRWRAFVARVTAEFENR